MLKKLLSILLVTSLLFMLSSCSPARQTEEPNASAEHSEAVNNGKEFDVIFKNFDGSVIKSEKVNKGDNATPPVGLEREGYKFVKWDKSFDNVTKDEVITAVYEKIKGPALVVDTVHAKGRNVIVKVNIKNNPGILTLLLNTVYVENVMTLTKIESGKAMEGYSFVGPKNLSNACNAAWYINNVPDKTTDGEVALLHFKLKKDAAPGAYEISISCDNGAFDDKYKEVKFETINGYVVIENEEETK